MVLCFVRDFLYRRYLHVTYDEAHIKGDLSGQLNANKLFVEIFRAYFFVGSKVSYYSCTFYSINVYKPVILMKNPV